MGGCLMLLQIWSWEHIHIGRPIIRTVRPDGQHDQEDDADDFEPILRSQHWRGMDPLAVSWLRVYLSRSHSPHTLVYYRDALDRQRDEQMTCSLTQRLRWKLYRTYVHRATRFGDRVVLLFALTSSSYISRIVSCVNSVWSR
ncbi:serine/threonine-protein phosphatase 7 long form homolog [Amaranthus tricolor]|uniref:serine/threonine-protein phosphatase 7 long form homolog n=1 Tax=Amaranthus tricolor TaxID=29722 RepID=UPI0025878113|nr:serine/threonine-protein phosphatase 7 long form homolog [Amaranthus tricolor]